MLFSLLYLKAYLSTVFTVLSLLTAASTIIYGYKDERDPEQQANLRRMLRNFSYAVYGCLIVEIIALSIFTWRWWRPEPNAIHRLEELKERRVFKGYLAIKFILLVAAVAFGIFLMVKGSGDFAASAQEAQARPYIVFVLGCLHIIHTFFQFIMYDGPATDSHDDSHTHSQRELEKAALDKALEHERDFWTASTIRKIRYWLVNPKTMLRNVMLDTPPDAPVMGTPFSLVAPRKSIDQDEAMPVPENSPIVPENNLYFYPVL